MTNFQKKLDERDSIFFRLDRKYSIRMRKYCHIHQITLQEFMERALKKAIEELVC